jgi:hypothetical protein
MNKRSMSNNPYSGFKNFYHHYNLSGHWDAKCWKLHPELHPNNLATKRRVWRVNIEEDDGLPTSPSQGEEFVHTLRPLTGSFNHQVSWSGSSDSLLESASKIGSTGPSFYPLGPLHSDRCPFLNRKNIISGFRIS